MCCFLPANSSEEDRTLAYALANQHHLDLQEIVLDQSVEQLKQKVENATKQTMNKLALGNMKSRLRMVSLYGLGQTLNYLVLGTGNAAELHVGYFTKHGDGGCDLLPIAGLVKGEVKQLAEFLEVLPAIINRAPSAGL
ncbi:unnamed protein product [Didymodactylos carnosus]|uniref:NAD/GMP synthase domain-containing protein n=1 Tax=Didymodactylos carnosus TaxID=1234261 RepID=A0A8S2D404_9BILA|nr:unnamed protein product [Didymodactylos carnosus]CAF3580045.1 unnamed protein product [Didymodactylos carnosus]